MRVINVGGGGRELPHIYDGWEQDLLDIDPNVTPDILCDAKDIGQLPGKIYDSVYTSHFLEHCYFHDVPKVLAGFNHVLKDTGFALIKVPDLGALFSAIQGKDIHSEWYKSVSGIPISFHDVLYGWGTMLEKGNFYFAHKCGFTERSLRIALMNAGFMPIFTDMDGLNLGAIAYKRL